MTNFWFNLNSTSFDLSLAELKEVFKQEKNRLQQTIKRDTFIICQFQNPPKLSTLNRLGGTLWLAEELEATTEPTDLSQKLENLITANLKSEKRFGIWFYNYQKFDPAMSQRLSEQLKRKIKLSYLNSHKPRLNRSQQASSLVLVIIKFKKTFYILKLTWYYPWVEFIHKDKYKAFVQPTAGMLPHKIARIMVNLSLDSRPDQIPENHFLLDPFAGSGTILIEALDMDIPTIGIEKYQPAYTGLKKNLANFVTARQIKQPYLLFNGDADRVDKIIPGQNKIASIVTEPYLGPAFRLKTNRYRETYLTTTNQPDRPLTREKIKAIIVGLERLYLSWLKHQAWILKPNTKLAIILPEFHFHNQFYRINIFDNHQLPGYTLYQGPYLIKSQRDLVIRRQIFIIKRK